MLQKHNIDKIGRPIHYIEHIMLLSNKQMIGIAKRMETEQER